jgi:hypothetical protein
MKLNTELLKVLNILLFSKNAKNLTEAQTRLNLLDATEKDKTAILKYCKLYNSAINHNLDVIELSVLDQQIINKFYETEAIHNFYGFTNRKDFVDLNDKIAKLQISAQALNKQQQKQPDPLISKLEHKIKESQRNQKWVEKQIEFCKQNEADREQMILMSKYKELGTLKYLNTKIIEEEQANIQQSPILENLNQKLEEYVEMRQTSEKELLQANLLDGSNNEQTKQLSAHKEAKEKYLKAFKFSKAIGDLIEANNTNDDSLAYHHAYSMLLAFNGIENYIEFFNINNVNFANVAKPVHDSFATFKAPINGQDVSLKTWQNLIKTHGKKAMKLFSSADQIETKKLN